MIHVARNGSQLGKFIVEEINMKLASGEFFLTDLAWTDGMATWEPLAQIPGVIPPLRPAGPPTPPAMPVVDPFAQPQPMAGQYPYPAYSAESVRLYDSRRPRPHSGPVSRPTSAMAIASLMCGTLSLLCVGSLLVGAIAVVLGHRARFSIRQSGGAILGDDMALAGLITGYFGLCIGGLLWLGMSTTSAFGR